MYRVYWSMPDLENKDFPRNFDDTVVDYKDFGDNEMSEAIQCVAACREAGYTFVTMVAGNVPGMVGQMGVAQVKEDYDWTKRRSKALRRDVSPLEREAENWPEEH